MKGLGSCFRGDHHLTNERIIQEESEESGRDQQIHEMAALWMNWRVDENPPRNGMELNEIQAACIRVNSSRLSHPTNRPSHPLITKPDWIPPHLKDHLLKNKKSPECPAKFALGDHITNMESILQMMIPVIYPIEIRGDFLSDRFRLLPRSQIRSVVLTVSALPDFEDEQVLVRLIRLEKDPIDGCEFSNQPALLSRQDKADSVKRWRYEKELQKWMIYHLTSSGRLPGLDKASDRMMTEQTAEKILKALINDDVSKEKIQIEVEKLFVRIRKLGIDHVLALEIVFQLFVNQIRNEYSIYKEYFTQGCIDTIEGFGKSSNYFGPQSQLLIYLRILAFKYLTLSEPDLFSSMHGLAIREESDEIVELWSRALIASPVEVIHYTHLFKKKSAVHPSLENRALIIKYHGCAFKKWMHHRETLSSSRDGIAAVSNARQTISKWFKM